MRRIRKVALLLCLPLVTTSCLRPVKFEGTSMLPMIGDGDLVLVSASVPDLKRGEIIHFKYPKDPSKYYLKRVIGLPGEIVEIRDGIVFIDGKELDENYVDPAYNTMQANFPPRRIGDAEYFVMGDNRDNSSDSRYWGTVNRGLIVGKMTSIYSRADKN